jgi:hypothetical protein
MVSNRLYALIEVPHQQMDVVPSCFQQGGYQQADLIFSASAMLARSDDAQSQPLPAHCSFDA